jgi:hypothetical protein
MKVMINNHINRAWFLTKCKANRKECERMIWALFDQSSNTASMEKANSGDFFFNSRHLASFFTIFMLRLRKYLLALAKLFVSCGKMTFARLYIFATSTNPTNFKHCGQCSSKI